MRSPIKIHRIVTFLGRHKFKDFYYHGQTILNFRSTYAFICETL
jgi:hypothetical protein